MSKLSKFNYNGSEITFDLGNGKVMANATDMAKAFKKRVPEWTRLQSSKEFLDHLWTIRNGKDPEVQKMHYDITQTNNAGLDHILKRFNQDLHLIVTISGGNNQGTWMHEDVAIEFARWLSPKFAIWCNDRIKELLTHGFTATPDKLDELVNNPDLIIKLGEKIKLERDRRRIAEIQQSLAEEVILQQAPKVQYHDQVLISERTYTTTTIAKELGTSAISFHKELNKKAIMYKADGHWVLYHRYQGKGFTKTRTATYIDRYGKQQSTITTVWTEKGREFLHKIFNPELS